MLPIAYGTFWLGGAGPKIIRATGNGIERVHDHRRQRTIYWSPGFRREEKKFVTLHSIAGQRDSVSDPQAAVAQ